MHFAENLKKTQLRHVSVKQSLLLGSNAFDSHENIHVFTLIDLWRKKLELLKEITEMSSNVKKVFVKLNWLKSY